MVEFLFWFSRDWSFVWLQRNSRSRAKEMNVSNSGTFSFWFERGGKKKKIL